ncbi:MAG: hypothetical protein ACTHM0_13415 [Sphingomonas sp.]
MARQTKLLEELVRASGELDRLIADMETGRPSQTRHDGHIDQVERLARRLIEAARGPGRPVNPPLGRAGAGFVW